MKKLTSFLPSPSLLKAGPRALRRSSFAITTLLLMAAWTTPVRAQIPNMVEAFKMVNETAPETSSLTRPASIKLPKGSNSFSLHQQSIQRTRSGGFIVSGSAQNTGYLYATNAQGVITSVVTPASGGFNHLGGFQVAGDVLAVGYEKSQNGGSKVLFFAIGADNTLRELPHLAFSRIRKTAGAVGLVRMDSSWRLVVGDWDSAQLDFYQCDQPDLRSAQSSFQLSASWSKSSDGLIEGSLHDTTWEAYQNLNLFQQRDGTLWMVGMHTGSRLLGRPDWADLYQVTQHDGRISLEKRGKKHFIAKGGPRFVFGAGYYWDADMQRFDVYAIAEHMDGDNTGTTTVNHWR